MELQLKVSTIKGLSGVLSNAEQNKLDYRVHQYGPRDKNKVLPLDVSDLSLDALAKVHKYLKECEEEDAPRLAKLIKTLKDPNNAKVTELKSLPTMLTAFLVANGKPLLHSTLATQRGSAYLPLEVRYVVPPPASYRDSPYVEIELGYNVKMYFSTYKITLHSNDVRNKTVPEILKAQNLMVPDETVTAEYEKIRERFFRYLQTQGTQYFCRGLAPEAGGKGFWWRSDEFDMTQMGMPTKAVLDLEYERNYWERRERTTASNTHYSSIYEDDCCNVPTHPVLPLFSLVHHRTLWVNVTNMKPYKYETGLGDKLVLPKSHTRLIGALVSNLDVLREESEADGKSRTIKNKAVSSIILAMGPPGTGKTLTAEVYAEEIQRPLYEVQTAQIGTNPEDIERNLSDILNRSIRLRMPLLINEADVFVRKRGVSLEQDAIVSVFLRLLEYHQGLVFLTTNRADDIDDAFMSRCIAQIRYEIPQEKERLRLWQIMAQEFNVELPKSELRLAVHVFPEIVGRDIQNLIRLTSRVCKAIKEPFNLDALIMSAAFRNLKVVPRAEAAKKLERVNE